MLGNSSGVRLRPATREDIPAIVMVSNSSTAEEDDIGFGTPRSELVFSEEARLSAAWEDPNFVREEEVWLAELDGRVVGCVTVEDRGEALELINIDVPRDRQGRGIGTRMVRLVEDRARREGKRSVTLGTSRNAAGVAWKSLPWWRSRGYRITGEEENDWTRSIGAGVREIRMEKEIPSDHRDPLATRRGNGYPDLLRTPTGPCSQFHGRVHCLRSKRQGCLRRALETDTQRRHRRREDNRV